MDLSGRSVKDLTRNETFELKLPKISSEEGIIVPVLDSAQFSNPHQSPMMPSESSCKRLISRLLKLDERERSSHGVKFQFGIFRLQGLQEFIAMHKAKDVAKEVCYIHACIHTVTKLRFVHTDNWIAISDRKHRVHTKS